jgi:hypothetical protein
MRDKDCKICLLEHDDEIHAATLSLHQWLRDRITRTLPQPSQDVEATLL